MQVASTKDNKPDVKKETSKVYIFIIAILALLATNFYFFIKFKSSGEQVYTLTVEKDNLQSQVDRIEAELDKLDTNSVDISPQMLVKKDEARKTIAALRLKLDKKELSQQDIDDAQHHIDKLKVDVDNYRVSVLKLVQENEILAKKNESLQHDVQQKADEIDHLKTSNKQLSGQVRSASGIKVSNIVVNGLRERRGGKMEVEERAKRIDKLRITFTLAENVLAKIGYQEVYVRIINAQGNLIAKESNIFYVNGEKLQYTFMKPIQFTNKGEEYEFIWSDSQEKFSKGAYTILLYADNAIMGRSTIILN